MVSSHTDSAACTPTELPGPLCLPPAIGSIATTYAVKAEQSRVHWLIRAIVDRKLQSDYKRQQELNIYTGTASVKAEVTS